MGKAHIVQRRIEWYHTRPTLCVCVCVSLQYCACVACCLHASATHRRRRTRRGQSLVAPNKTSILTPPLFVASRTPLYHAARLGRVNIVKLLVDHAAAAATASIKQARCSPAAAATAPAAAVLEMSDNSGYTPLHAACMGGTRLSYTCAQLLINAGADVNAAAKDGSRPIMLLSRPTRPSPSTCLRECCLAKNQRMRKHDLNRRMHYGDVYGGQLATLLLKHGASMQHANAFGNTVSVAFRTCVCGSNTQLPGLYERRSYV